MDRGCEWIRAPAVRKNARSGVETCLERQERRERSSSSSSGGTTLCIHRLLFASLSILSAQTEECSPVEMNRGAVRGRAWM